MRKRIKPTDKTYTCPHTGIVFRSTHEAYFYWWLLDLYYKGFVKMISREKTIPLLSKRVRIEKEQLKTKVREKEAVILKPMTYTYDFKIIFNEKLKDILFGLIDDEFKPSKGIVFKYGNQVGENYVVFVDVKNPYNKNNVKSTFSIIRKVVYDKHKVYVHEVEVLKLFYLTFYPKLYFKTDSGKSDRKMNLMRCDKIEDYLSKVGL